MSPCIALCIAPQAVYRAKIKTNSYGGSFLPFVGDVNLAGPPQMAVAKNTGPETRGQTGHTQSVSLGGSLLWGNSAILSLVTSGSCEIPFTLFFISFQRQTVKYLHTLHPVSGSHVQSQICHPWYGDQTQQNDYHRLAGVGKTSPKINFAE